MFSDDYVYATFLYIVDWAAIGSWLQALAGFSGVGAVIWAAHVGSARFKDWLLQKQTERRMEAADRILRLTYRLKRVFPSIRFPGWDGFERTRAEQRLTELYDGFAGTSGTRRERLIRAQIIVDRIHAHRTEWDELFACLPIAAAYFGKKVEDPLDSLLRQQIAVRVAADSYAGPAVTDTQQDFIQKMESKFSEGSGEITGHGDEVTENINAAITALIDVLMPILRSEVET